MKNFARFSQYRNRYWCEESTNFEMYLIGSFFGTDIGCRTDDFFTKWLSFSNQFGPGGNATVVCFYEDEKTYRVDRNIVEIRDALDEENGPVFRMPTKEYKKMVLQWQALCKLKPKEIIITWNGKKIIVEGRN